MLGSYIYKFPVKTCAIKHDLRKQMKQEMKKGDSSRVAGKVAGTSRTPMHLIDET